MPRFGTALLSATRPPEAARPCHARPTQQPSRSPAKEQAPTPNSASGERGASKGAAPGPRHSGGPLKHGNPKMQQHNNVCINELMYCCCTSLPRCCCTWSVLGWVGRWVGCCTCCFCCSSAAVVLLDIPMPNSTCRERPKDPRGIVKT